MTTPSRTTRRSIKTKHFRNTGVDNLDLTADESDIAERLRTMGYQSIRVTYVFKTGARSLFACDHRSGRAAVEIFLTDPATRTRRHVLRLRARRPRRLRRVALEVAVSMLNRMTPGQRAEFASRAGIGLTAA